MNLNKTLVTVLAMVVTWPAFACPAFAQEQSSWRNNVCEQLNGLGAGKDVVALSKIQLHGLQLSSRQLDPNDAVPAIFELWTRGDLDYLQLTWWRKDERVARTVILSLFLASTTEPVEWVPDFQGYVKRFSAKERKDREEELQFVLEHRSAIAGYLARATEVRGQHFGKITFEGMSKAKLGTDLVCKPAQ